MVRGLQVPIYNSIANQSKIFTPSLKILTQQQIWTIMVMGKGERHKCSTSDTGSVSFSVTLAFQDCSNAFQDFWNGPSMKHMCAGWERRNLPCVPLTLLFDQTDRLLRLKKKFNLAFHRSSHSAIYLREPHVMARVKAFSKVPCFPCVSHRHFSGRSRLFVAAAEGTFLRRERGTMDDGVHDWRSPLP